MNVHYRLKVSARFSVVLAIVAVGLSGCGAARQAYKRGNQAEIRKDFDTAMAQYKTALDENPGNIEYRLKYEQARFAAAFEHFERGRRAVETENYATAKMEFTRTLEIDPTHTFAKQQLARVNDLLANRSRNAPEPQILLDQMKEATRTDASVQSQLDPKITGPIDLHITQDSRVAFETIAQLAGLNIIFDPDFRGTRIPIDLNKVDIYEALDIVALQTRSFWKPVNRSTILISPDNQTKRRDYDELVLKTIYLSNSVTSTEITEAITALRTLLNMRYLAQSTAMNAIIIRDTADRIAIAEKIIGDLDKSKAEVVVEATVLEVDRNKLQELGILPPSGTSLTYSAPGSTTTTSTTGTTTTTTPANNSVRLRDIDAINSGSFSVSIPETVARFLASSNNARLIQNPRIRATDGKLAQIRIGSKIPVPSGSFQPAFVGATGTPVVQFQYLDVGVNLDITPRVLLNREISMTVAVQVAALAGDRNVGGAVLPVFTNRSIQHEIRLVEGETNILGGIISDSESLSFSGIPGLKDIPLLKYLFSQERRTRDSTEIIVMLTPHIVRMPNILEANMRGMYTGSESIPRLRTTPDAAAIGGPAGSAPVPPSPQIPAPPPGNGAPALIPPVPVPGAPGAPGAQGPPGGANPAQAELRPTNATLTFSPAPLTLAANGQTQLSIVLNGNNIFGVDITLSFDPAAFLIREVLEGGFLSRDGQLVSVVQRLDTQTGMATLAFERPPGAPAISGTGNLVTLLLERGSRSGDSTLRVVDFRVRDAQQTAQIGRPSELRVTVP
jgi:general secretion pathway protein D